MQRGVLIWEAAAGYLGMSPKVLQDTYAPDHPQNAVDAMGRKPEQKRDVSGAVTSFRKIDS